MFRANTKETAERGGRRPHPLWWRPKTGTFVLALKKAHVLVLNTAHVLRLNKADVLALSKAHVLRLNIKICPAYAATTKKTTRGGGGLRTLPLCGFLFVGCEHWAYLMRHVP